MGGICSVSSHVSSILPFLWHMLCSLMLFQPESTVQIQAAQEKRKQISAHLHGLLGKDGVLMLPTAPGPAPILNTPPAELDLFRSRLLSLKCIAGLGGLPQVQKLTQHVGTEITVLSLVMHKLPTSACIAGLDAGP